MTVATTRAPHPLDPLAAEEIDRAVAVLRAERKLGPEVFFVRVQLEEPPRPAVLAYRDGDALDRRALIILRDRQARATVEAVVSLTRAAVVDWRERTGVAPPIVFDEALACEA